MFFLNRKQSNEMAQTIINQDIDLHLFVPLKLVELSCYV